MITCNLAQEAVDLIEQKAQQLGLRVTAVITDEHGTPIVLKKMDRSILISIEMAQIKAFTSAYTGLPTAQMGDMVLEGKPYFGLTNIAGGKFTTFPGGIPIIIDGQIKGAIGVGGSVDPAQDAQCAEVAAIFLADRLSI